MPLLLQDNAMRIFYISLTIFVLIVAWLLNKPIPKQPVVARAFTDAEVEYIEKSFDYAMETLKDGDAFDWSAAGVNARISASAIFLSNQKADCRHYVEIMRTADSQRTEKGLACKRSGEQGWCRLSYDVPQSCALEKTDSQLAKRARFSIMQGAQMIDGLLGNDVSMGNGGLAPSSPTIDPINTGRPNVEKPKVTPHDFHPPMPWEKSK